MFLLILVHIHFFHRFSYLYFMITTAICGAGTLIHPEHLSSPPVFSGVCAAQSLVFFAVFCILLLVPFLSAIMLSVLLFKVSG
jgi:hypothetical protein